MMGKFRPVRRELRGTAPNSFSDSPRLREYRYIGRDDRIYIIEHRIIEVLRSVCTSNVTRERKGGSLPALFSC